MTFAIITPALIVGAFAERMKFSAMLLFMVVWVTVVYAPICHMNLERRRRLLLGPGHPRLRRGTVVHINAGVAALGGGRVVIGRRRGYPDTIIRPTAW